jgi:hypothetical protein
MEFVRQLVALGYIDANAVDIVHSKRDHPSHGIGLRYIEGIVSKDQNRDHE